MDNCCVNPIICKTFVALVFIVFTTIFIGLLIAFIRSVRRSKEFAAEEGEEGLNDRSLR